MKLKRYNVSDDYYRSGFSEDDRGDWCMSVHVDVLEAENDALRAKLARYENDGTTHDANCWSWGPKHYECALAEIERLKADGENESHPDDVAVDDFAKAMKAKMKTSREKGRRGWEYGNIRYLAAQLIYHVKKGDPVDVANFCMMLHNRGQSGILSHAWAAEVEGKARLKVLSAQEVTETGFYWNNLGPKNNDWRIVRVVRYGVLEDLHIMNSFGGYYPLKHMTSQFIGPLTPPEG